MTSVQRHGLKISIEWRDKKDLVAEVVSLVGTPTACPHCHHPEIRPWGHAVGLPRFRCRGCKRTFNALMGTPLAGLHHKDRWMFFLEKFNEGESVRKAAFLWRHRFLALPANLKARRENGIVETDETWFLRSYKGQRGRVPETSPRTGSKFWSCRTGRARPPRRSFRRTTTGRSKRCSDPSWLGIRSSVPMEETRAPSPWRARAMGVARRAVNLSKGIRVLVFNCIY